MATLAEQTRAIVETAGDGIITYDAEGWIRSANRSARRIFAITSEEGVNIQHLFRLEQIRAGDFFSAGVEGGEQQEDIDTVYGLESCEMVGLRKDVGFLCDVTLSRATVGHSPMFIAVVRDLTKKKQLEARLSQARNMEKVGQLAAGVAHEINTPIQFIGNNIEFMRTAFEDIDAILDLYDRLQIAVRNDGQIVDVITDIQTRCEQADLPFLRSEFPLAISQSLDGIDRVATIVRAMKEFSSPSTETRATIDLNRSIQNALAISANRFRDIANVKTTLDTKLPSVVGIGGQINQAILNIITNAADAIEKHRDTREGLVEVETRHLEDDIEIRFHDNGCGIPDNVSDRIFDPFFSTKEVGKGTGQGLAFVYDVIVNKHAGAISTLAREGGGTTFLVTLPINTSETHHRRAHESTVG